MEVLAVIPARYASMRFPGKPLAIIDGKTMVRHVYDSCKAAPGINRVIVATEDERIERACRDFGGEAELTSSQLPSGTDRVAVVAQRHPEFDVVLNVQGDEPAIEPETIQAVASALHDPDVQIATAMTRFQEDEEVASPNAVKVVVDSAGRALYFSRSVIPFYRDASSGSQVHFRHLGIYGFRRSALSTVTRLAPSNLERAESLEQLRWLEAGFRIHCVLVSSRSRGIDTPDDLQAFLKMNPPQIKSTTL